MVCGGRAFCLRARALRRWCRGCVGQSLDVCMCIPLMSKGCLRGSTSVSLWRWGRGVVCVKPVAIRSALFLVVCSFFMCVVFVSSCQTGLGVCKYETGVLLMHQVEVFFVLA